MGDLKSKCEILWNETGESGVDIPPFGILKSSCLASK